jgi:hypothetical protein
MEALVTVLQWKDAVGSSLLEVLHRLQYRASRRIARALPVTPKPEVERPAHVDTYPAALGATVHLGGDRATG